jgi:glycosyltransferase EpsD
MKILYVTTNSNTVNTFLIPHIKFLVEQGNEVAVAFNIVQEVSSELVSLGCKIHQVDFQRNPLKKENVTAYKKVKEIVLKEGYEMIHVHTPVASFITRLACRNIKNVQVLYTAHGFHFFKGAPKINWFLFYTLEKLAARWTDALITMNEEDYEAARKLKLRSGNSIFKVHGVGLDINTFLPQTKENKERLRTEYGYDLSDFILIYVGELSYRKHQDLLIEAVNLLKGVIPQLKLLLVGDGDLLMDYKVKARRLQVENQIQFLGYRKDVAQLMTVADMAISSSRQEGLPVNIMEAMATELPVIVTNCRGNRDLVGHGYNGFVIGEDSAFAFAEAIQKLYYSETMRKEFAKKSRELIQAYSIENVMNDMREVYTRQSSISINDSSKSALQGKEGVT